MNRPSSLAGRRIVVTRNLESAGRFSDRLRQLGADVLELPLIRVTYEADRQMVADIFREIAQYEWTVFTSAHGVRGFFREFGRAFEDIRALGPMRIAAVGDGTAEAIRKWHLQVDLQPHEATADALAETLAQEQSLDNLRILVVTGNRNRPDLVKRLNEARAIVDTLEVYRTDLIELAADPAAISFREQGADALVFASSSAVESFGRQAAHLKLSPAARIPALASFGPQTTATMKQSRIPVALEAATPSVDAMVAALEAHFEER